MRFCFLFLFIATSSCGFSSYYGTSIDSKKNTKNQIVKEQIMLTMLNYSPLNNDERIFKEKILDLMERNDINNTEDARYVLLTYNSYQKMIDSIIAMGTSLSYSIQYTTLFYIFDIQKITTPSKIEKIILGKDDQDEDDILAKKISPLEDKEFRDEMSEVGDLNAGTSYNSTREKAYLDKVAHLKSKNYKIVHHGRIVNRVSYSVNPAMLNTEYASEIKSLELVAKRNAEDLMYRLIATYSMYIKHSINGEEVVFKSEPTPVDNAVEKAADKVDKFLSVDTVKRIIKRK